MDQVGLNQTLADALPDSQSGEAALRLLLCEDNRGDFTLLRGCLEGIEGRSFDIDWRRTVEDGIAALHAHSHDVALVDYRLVGGCGLDILREAVAIDWRGPVIMLTSLTDPSVDIACMKLGAADFISKDELRPTLVERSIRYGMEKKRLEIAAQDTNRELLQFIAELRQAKHEIDMQNQRIVSLAYHLASASHGEGYLDRTGISMAPRRETGSIGQLGIWHFDADGRTHLANSVVLELLELKEMESLTQRSLEALLSNDSRQRLRQALRSLSPDAALTIEIEVVGQMSGRHSWVVMSLLPPAPDEPEKLYMATIVDITSRRNVEIATLYLAKHDSLTRLANRASFDERLRQITASARRSSSLVGLICVDLDDFKQVNDCYGHQAGDKLLQQVARRLGEVTRESDIVARLGGDEFGIIATNLKHYDDVAVVARKVSGALGHPFQIRDREIASGASVGFAVFPTDGEDLEDLFERADAALYRDKRRRSITSTAP